MRRASNLLEAVLHRDMFTLEPWLDRSLLKVNKNTCNILHPGWNNPRQVETGRGLSRRHFCGNKSRIQVKNKWKTSQKCALAVREVQCIPDCTIQSVVNRIRKEIFSLYSALLRVHLECCVQFWAPQCEKDTCILE